MIDKQVTLIMHTKDIISPKIVHHMGLYSVSSLIKFFYVSDLELD